jgi:TatD DNase family protein
MSFLIDSHCHLDRLDLKNYDGSLDRALEHAEELGVGHMLCVSIDMGNFPDVLALAHRYEQVSASVGVHPNERVSREVDADELIRLAADPQVVAIGETGLDYFRSEGDLEWQRDRFRRHITAAKQTGKPLIIHMRDATADTLRIMDEEGAGEAGGVMHCFVEDWDTAKAAMDLNFYISFSGIVTFNSAKTLQDVAARMPIDRMLVETDSPYLAPVPYRGKPNQPAYVRYVAERIAELRGTSFEDIAGQTTDNYFRLFGRPEA